MAETIHEEDKAVHPRLYRQAVTEITERERIQNFGIYLERIRQRYKELCDLHVGDKQYFN